MYSRVALEVPNLVIPRRHRVVIPHLQTVINPNLRTAVTPRHPPLAVVTPPNWPLINTLLSPSLLSLDLGMIKLKMKRKRGQRRGRRRRRRRRSLVVKVNITIMVMVMERDGKERMVKVVTKRMAATEIRRKEAGETRRRAMTTRKRETSIQQIYAHGLLAVSCTNTGVGRKTVSLCHSPFMTFIHLLQLFCEYLLSSSTM